MLYLVQHGEAMAKDQDPDRPLTERGEVDVRHLGEFLGRAAVGVEAIYDSGKLRARQTAEILSEYVTPGLAPEDREGLGPNDPTAPFLAEIDRWNRSVVIVSHMPFVGRLTAALVGGREEHPPVAFTPGAMVALEHGGEAGWQVSWMLRPELLR